MESRAVVVAQSSVEGVVRAPPSKSYTHRAIALALLAEGETVIVDPLWSSDTLATLKAAESLGLKVYEKSAERLVSYSPGSRKLSWTPCLDVGESGTSMRLFTAVAALLDKPILIYGRGRLHERPVKPLLEALARLGARHLLSNNCCPPHVVQGPVSSGSTVLDAWESSQYLSAILILGAGVDGGVGVSVSRLESRPYVDVTVRVLEAFGVLVERRGYEWFYSRGPAKPVVFRVPGDWSSAAVLLAAGAIAGRVRVEGVDAGDPQSDRVIVDVLEAAGARVSAGEGFVEASSTAHGLQGFRACIQDSPDLGPLLAAIAALSCGESEICCVERLKLKESDRVEAILDLLKRSGVNARLSTSPSGRLCITVQGSCGVLEGGVTYDSHGDHRIAMAAALLGLASRKPVTVMGADTVAKSYPEFWDRLRELGARVGHA